MIQSLWRRCRSKMCQFLPRAAPNWSIPARPDLGPEDSQLAIYVEVNLSVFYANLVVFNANLHLCVDLMILVTPVTSTTHLSFCYAISFFFELLVFLTSPELLFFAMVISRLALSKVVIVLLTGVFLLMIMADVQYIGISQLLDVICGRQSSFLW